MKYKGMALKDIAHKYGIHEETFKRAYYRFLNEGMSKEDAIDAAINLCREKGLSKGVELAEIAYKYQGVKLV